MAVPVPQIQEQIVDVPVPQIMEGTIEVAKLIPQERIQRRTLEETVSVPLPQIYEQILEAVKALFDRRGLVQQLLTCVFFLWTKESTSCASFWQFHLCAR